jgi:outer membrane protein X
MSRRLSTTLSVCPLLAVAALLFAGTASAQAENYQPVRFNVGLLVPYTPDTGSGGFGGVVEGKYNLTDQIAIGLRLDGAVQFGGSVGRDSASIDVGAVAAMLAKAEYFLTDSTVRPFVGFAAGMYTLGGQSVTAGEGTAGVTQAAGRAFGMAPQLGVDLGVVRLAATYNVLLDGELVVQEVSTDGSPPPEVSVSRNYFGFELSFRIGGRRRPRPATAADEAGAAPAPSSEGY